MGPSDRLTDGENDSPESRRSSRLTRRFKSAVLDEKDLGVWTVPGRDVIRALAYWISHRILLGRQRRLPASHIGRLMSKGCAN
jgi:hypothetical protein